MSRPRLLSETIPAVTSQVFSRKYAMLGRLVTRWEDIVGQDLATKTQPVKIRYIKHKTEKKPKASLDIACSTAEATLLHYKKDLILERVNQIFGDQWITAIRFVPQEETERLTRKKPKKEKPLSEKDNNYLSSLLDKIEDDDLKQRLESFGKAFLQDKEK